MDPFTLSLITGIIANCMYSSVFRIADETVDILLSEKNIIDRLTKNEANFASIIEVIFQNISPVIKPEKFYEFLKSNEGIEIVERIYSYNLSDVGELNNLEKVKKDFCERITLYFSNSEEMSTAAPELFFLLVKCCQESLDVIIKEKGFSAFDYKIKVYFNILDERLDKYQKQLLDRVETNKKLITQVLVFMSTDLLQ